MERSIRNILEEARQQRRRARQHRAMGYGCILLAGLLAIVFFL